MADLPDPAAAEAELAAMAADPQTVLLELRKLEALHVLLHLQISLSHPAHSPDSADVVRRIANRIQPAVVQTPAVAAIVEAGWADRAAAAAGGTPRVPVPVRLLARMLHALAGVAAEEFTADDQVLRSLAATAIEAWDMHVEQRSLPARADVLCDGLQEAARLGRRAGDITP